MYKKILAITFAVILLSTVALSNTIPAHAVPQASIMVNAISANNETLHMGVTITSGGATVQTGNTPLNFMGAVGKTYSITVSNQLQTTISNYNQTIFNHWQNDGTTLPTQTITLSQNTALTAIYNKGETIPLVDIGILQLAAHDLYNHLNPNHPPTFRGDNLEDERLNLSTLLDNGLQNIATGGEPRNTENIITFTVASQLGHQYLNYIKHGKTPLEARELTVQTFMTELKSAYFDAFHESFPLSQTLDGLSYGSAGTQYPNDADADLALRTLHSFVPGHITVNGTNYSILDPSLYLKTADSKSLKGLSKPLDGTFDPVLLNITEQISPTQFIQVNLQDRDTTFGEQFHTDFTFPQLLNEIRDGSFGQYSDPLGAFRQALENSQTVILLNATSGLPGATVAISGVNFNSNSTYPQSPNVIIQMNDKSNTPHLDTLKTSPSIITASNGIFGTGSIYMAPTVTFTVPRVPPGHYTIYASNGNESASVPFTVLSMHNIHHGPKVGANIATGSGVTDVKVNENTNTIYSANYFSNSTSVIDGKTNQITATIPLSGNPEALAIDPISDKIYVGNVTGSYQAVTVIDGKTNKILDVIPAGYGSPTSMAVDYNTHRLYLANYVNNTIIIDTTTDKVIDTIPNNWPYYLAVNEKTDKAYVVDTWDAVVDVIDSKTDQVIDTISLGAPASPNLCWINFTCDTFGNQPFSIWINENTNTIYVDNGDGSLVAIDGNTDKVIYDIPNETSTIGFGDVNDNTNTVYNADQLTSYLYVVNGNTGKITDSIFVGTSPSFNQCLADPTCTDPLTIPYGVAVNDKTGIIYVADFGDNNGLGGSVIILDAKTHHKMGEIHMDKGLHHN